MRKLINAPEDFADEVLDGILKAHPESLRAVTDDKRALVRADAPGTRVGVLDPGVVIRQPTRLSLPVRFA